jgi:uncharacterized repeat protein (TIGR01451 family)
MASFRTKRRARRMLLPFLMTTTGVLFLAPSADAAPTVITVTNAASPAEGGSAAAGSTITYNISVTAGANDATGVVLSVAQDANTTYTDGSAVLNGGNLGAGATNPFADGEGPFTILAGGTATASYSVTVNSPLADSTPLTNTASVTADEPDAGSVLSDDANHTVSAAPALQVTKTSVPPEGDVAPTDLITYTMVVENLASGTDSTVGLQFTDPTPTNTTYVDGSATVDGGAPIPGGNPFATPYTLGELAPGESHTMTFQVNVNPPPLPNNTPITNTATASATNNPAVNDSVTHTVDSIPGLTVDKTAAPAEGGPVGPGTTITYTIAVANDPAATETATGVTLTDPTPVDTTYVADSASVDGGAPIPGATNPFEAGLPLPPMPPGSSHSATFQVLVDTPLDNGTLITNNATVSSTELPDVSNDAVHTVQSAPVLTMTKTSAPAETGKVTPGTTVTYSILMTNDLTATEVAHNVTLLDPTPANMVYVPSSAKVGGASVGGDPNPLADPYPLPDLAPGESQTITFDARVVTPLANGTVITNLAKMTADNHADLEDAATHTVDSAAVLKVATDSLPKPGSKVKGGQTITFDALVQNDQAATDSLKNVIVTASAPGGTTFVGGSVKVDGVTAPGSGSGATTLAPSNPLASGYALGTMAPGVSHTISYKAKVKDSAGSITGTWTVTAEGLTAVTATTTLRGPNTGGESGDGDGGDGGSGSDLTDGTSGTGSAVEATSDELAFTGLELTRLLLLAMTLLLAGWTLMARGRSVQRRNATAAVHAEQSDNDASAVWDRWVGTWFYPESRR